MIDLGDPLLCEQIVEAVRQRKPELVPGLAPCPARDLAEALVEVMEAEAEHDHNDCSECEARSEEDFNTGQDSHDHNEDTCAKCRDISGAAYDLAGRSAWKSTAPRNSRNGADVAPSVPSGRGALRMADHRRDAMPRLSEFPRRTEGPVRTNCAECGRVDVTVHPRRIGGGYPVLKCNACTRDRRAKRRSETR